MIKLTTKKGATEVTICGTPSELGADTLCIIRSVYNGIKEEDERAGKMFKETLIDNIEKAFSVKLDKADKKPEDKKCEKCGGEYKELKKLLNAVKDLFDDED